MDEVPLSELELIEVIELQKERPEIIRNQARCYRCFQRRFFETADRLRPTIVAVGLRALRLEYEA
ncbi:hypothetical protein METH_22545 (plasmid) [Leisingera methylohalidivorans DSM 14336]|uniref:Uncharacterized protein n=1 Tax=Leisingera methylohalidivorans DSM 14336 TaxID=999552 RepID=V9VXZ4_9RHOB|nr:hypothetical protein METH_22545 [Leisingera methylohalidivorans DSM 14336]